MNNRRAIVILTRGYIEDSKYISLITRNKGISENLFDKNIDILIFHEGNISEGQKIYIKTQTPDLNIIFKNISELAFQKENEIHKWYEKTEPWKIGYRHMCHFWFIDFLKFVEEYDYIIRIDEDCFIDFNLDEIFELCKNKIIISGIPHYDEEYLTFGLNKFTLDFLEKNGIENKNTKSPDGPYTNMCAFNLIKIRNNDLLKKYIECVDKSNNIYVYRWGDLPLWGEVLHYFYNESDYLYSDKIKYFHGSLSNYVNGSTNKIQEKVDLVYNNKEKAEFELNKKKYLEERKRKYDILLHKLNEFNNRKNSMRNRFNFIEKR